MSDLETSTERRPASLWLRFLLGLGVGVVVLIVLGVVVQQMHESSTTKGGLRQLVRQLDESDPNWRLDDLEHAREQPREDENSARVVMNCVRLVPREWGKVHIAIEEKLRSDPPLPLPVLLDKEQEAELAKGLDMVAPAVDEARKLATMPRGRHRLTLAFNPFMTLLPDQQETRRAASLLQLDAMLRTQRGDLHGALVSSRACLNAGRSLGDEPFLISQLIRIACVSIACGMVERVLAQGEATDADLADLQKALAEEDRDQSLLAALRGERGVLADLFTKLEDGKVPMKELRGLTRLDPQAEASWRLQLLGISKADIRRDHIRMLEVMNQLVEAGRLPSHEQIAAERKVEAQMKSWPADAVVARALVPAVGKVCESGRRKLARVRSLIVLLAVERYRLKDKAWPDGLDHLKPALLAEVPLDPFDGKPIRYRKLADGVVAYSVGQDGKDDGGNFDRSPGLPLDEGCRLWDVKARRQQPAPPPQRKP
jgi:hypothetical protein